MKYTNLSQKGGAAKCNEKSSHLRGATSIQSWRMLSRSLVPFCIIGGLGLPALVIAYICRYETAF